ncbi:MAG: hypothetical protein U5K54_02715 [Cytophagales bacterium]|nr:hypothetical protein [Cytophagales bacterium]
MLNDQTKLKVTTLLMGKSELSVDFGFDLKKDNGDHWFKGSLNRFDLTELNKVFVPFKAISIRSGQLDRLTFSVRLNNDVSDGELSFLYSNLKIDRLNKDDLKNRDFDNSFKSLLANTFLIKKSNPSGNSDPRIGVIHYKRAKEKSIFDFWIKSVLDGMRSTILSVEPSK